MAIPVTCDLCGATTAMPAEYAGAVAECPRCLLRLAVPVPETVDDFPWAPDRDAGPPETAWELPVVLDEDPRG